VTPPVAAPVVEETVAPLVKKKRKKGAHDA
jgi:hypothetical protein